MPDCSRCSGFTQRVNFEHPHEYLDIARQLIENVDQGTFVLVKADCPLKDLFQSTWPGDVLVHEFKCAACGRTFELSADTYHGNAHWSPID
jgi:uncharacterized Zn-finger protein